MPGYSQTPLIRKLGFQPDQPIVAYGAPDEYPDWLRAPELGLRIKTRSTRPIAAAHVFATRRASLEKRIVRLRQQLEPNGFAWISWPKKASGVTTDITEDVIREIALPLGLVDIKVCAVSDVWSGLKLVIRRELRAQHQPA